MALAHERRYFECGEPALDAYIGRSAWDDAQAGVARTFVAVEPDNPRRAIGYYTIGGALIDRANLPSAAPRRLPRFPLSLARVTRLAVDQASQGEGLGEHLLMDALERVRQTHRASSPLGVVVEVREPKHRRFFARYELEPLTDRPLTMWLPSRALCRLFPLG